MVVIAHSRDDASVGEREAAAAIALLTYLAPAIRQAANLSDEGWNSFLDGVIGAHAAGASQAAETTRVHLEQLRARE